MTPRKSTGGRFPTGQLAPRHRLEDVEEEREEFQPKAEIEENQRRSSQNQKRKILRRLRWRRRSHWSSRSCTMAPCWRQTLKGHCDSTNACGK
jgi:hypothetical protein